TSIITTHKGNLIAKTNIGAPNYRVVSINPQNPGKENWNEVVSEKEYVITSVSTTGGKLFLKYLKDAASRIYQYSLSGKKENRIKLPTLGTANGFKGEREDSITFYSFNSFTYRKAKIFCIQEN
ncbi:MAG: hypothetical protein ABEH43_03455, partial [Flavobacteriales bacterium]